MFKKSGSTFLKLRGRSGVDSKVNICNELVLNLIYDSIGMCPKSQAIIIPRTRP